MAASTLDWSRLVKAEGAPWNSTLRHIFEKVAIERQRAEEALHKSEEYFRLLVEGVQDYAIFMLDPEGRVIIWNAGAERIMGYQPEEILGQHFSRFYEPVEVEQHKSEQGLKAAAASGRWEDEGWRLRKDGSRFWANVIITAVRDNKGTLLGFSKVTRDLTERKRLEQELQHERDRLRLLLDLNNSFASNLDLAQLLRAVAAGLRDLAPTDAAILLLPELETDEIRICAMDFPDGKGLLKEDTVYPMAGSIEGHVFRTAKHFLFSGVPGWLNPKMQALLTQEGLHSGCALPLISRGAVVGILSLACRRENGFADVDLLVLVAAQLAIAVKNALLYRQVSESRERLAGEKRYLENEIRRDRDFGDIVGKSPTLKRVLEHVVTVATTDSTVLILGETGTGKELIARAIHNLGPRRDHTLVRVNCASVPAGLLENEFFGHEKGAFTGAVGREIGRFEMANQGTLFLDEVGDIPLELQSKLLRVLQEQEFERLGSGRTIRTDFRLIAASNRDLAQMVEDRQFRSDLYYRLNIFPVCLPPLRERREDIPLLVRHFVRHYAGRMKKRIESIPAETMDAFTQYHWPGNIRELQNLIERAAILSSGPVLHAPLADLKMASQSHFVHGTTLEEAERGHILQALGETDWVIGGPHGAAARLGLRRTSLLYKMRRLGISRPGVTDRLTRPDSGQFAAV